MELGICVASKIDDIDYIVRAEELGYRSAWLADSQMLWSDPYAALALAAWRTSTIRVGTGVSVAPTRPAPVTASSIATINCWVLAEEERFLTRELLEASCMIGSAEELIERLRALENAGLDQVMILPNLEPRYEVLEQVAAEVLPHV